MLFLNNITQRPLNLGLESSSWHCCVSYSRFVPCLVTFTLSLLILIAHSAPFLPNSFVLFSIYFHLTRSASPQTLTCFASPQSQPLHKTAASIPCRHICQISIGSCVTCSFIFSGLVVACYLILDLDLDTVASLFVWLLDSLSGYLDSPSTRLPLRLWLFGLSVSELSLLSVFEHGS